MATTIGMGVKKKIKKEDSEKVNELNAKIAELEKEKTDLIKKVDEKQKENAELSTKIAELEKNANS